MRKVLIVVDMQNDFITGSLGSQQAQAIVPNVKKKIDAYRTNGDTVIFTRDTHNENYLETQEGKNLQVVHCIEGTDGWEIEESLGAGQSIVWDKPTFGSKHLAFTLLEQGDVGEIEMVGLCTDICVVSNALLLKAYLPEVPITVDASCCAGVTEESHKAALLTMKMCQVNIINE